MNRIGFAKDIHRLIENRPLILSGVTIPYTKGEDAYSDGDVVFHSISEAMLGALALGDLGEYFPNNNPKFKNIDSSKILLECFSLIKSKGYNIVNIDASVELESPKIASFLMKMRTNVASLLKININQISIKANTNEKMDAIGHNEAVSCSAIVLLEK